LDRAKYEPPGIAAVSRTSKDFELDRSKSRWCPEPESNRHGLAAEGFSYPLQLSLLSLRLIWGLDFLFAVTQKRRAG